MSEPKEPSRIVLLLRALRDSLRHNMGYKILALILAIALWAGLITQDPNLTREKIMPDTAVSINGAATVQNRGLVITGGLENIDLVTIRAEVPQRQYSAATGTQYRPTVDLSRITETGEQEIPITTSNTSTYGNVISVTPSSVWVTVENSKLNNRVKVEKKIEGSLPEGWILSRSEAEIENVTVAGPESLVNRVDRVYLVLNLADIDVSKPQDAVRCVLRPVDRNGAVVSSDLLVIRYEGESIEMDYMDVEVRRVETPAETDAEEKPSN